MCTVETIGKRCRKSINSWRRCSKSKKILVFGRPFVKWFALCYRSVVLSVLSVCLSVTLVYCGQTVGRIKMKLGVPVGLVPGHNVLGGDPAAPLPKGHSPHFRPISVAAWIKMPLGTEVGLGPHDIVLDADPATLPKKGQSPPPIFGPCLLSPNGWIDQDETWRAGRPRPWPHCVRREHSSPPPKGHLSLIHI